MGDALGQVTSMTLGNNTSTTYAYDNAMRLTNIRHWKSDLSSISSFDYTYDPVGNRTKIVREDGAYTYYDYDATDQLTYEEQFDSGGASLYAFYYQYDQAGNRLSKVFNQEVTYYEYNAANELLWEEVEGEHTYYHYDHCGNTVARQEAAGTTYYNYDSENLMEEVLYPDATANYFAYDADNRRIFKQTTDESTYFFYEAAGPAALTQERDESDALVAQYTLGLGLESQRRDTTSSFYHYDALGSTHHLTDANEDVTDTCRYDAWGNVLLRTGSTVNPHSYVGCERYYFDAAAGLYLLGVRHYDMRSGRFVTLDPVRDGANWQLYPKNNPVAYADPGGRSAWRIVDMRETWTASYERSYRAFATGCHRWVGWGYDCTDFALFLLVEFARRSNLRLIVRAGGTVYDSCQDAPRPNPRGVNWRDNWKRYLKEIRGYVGSMHMPANTRPVAVAAAGPGDYLVYKGHVRVIRRTYQRRTPQSIRRTMAICQGYDPVRLRYTVTAFTCPYGNNNPAGTDCRTYYPSGPWDLTRQPGPLVGGSPREWHQLP